MFVCICISKMSNLRLHCLYRWLQFAFGQEEQRPPRESVTLSPPSTQPPKGKPLKSSGDMGNVNEDRMNYFLLTMPIPGTWEPWEDRGKYSLTYGRNNHGRVRSQT